MTKGLFITFEGPDGSGKTTQVEMLRDFLLANGYEVYLTREPGGTRIGEKIRDIVLDKTNSEMSDTAEMLLYAASRAQHVDQVIRPHLAAGRTVISDRFVDSSIVYQGYGRKLGEKVRVVNDYAIRDCVPDATFLLLLKPEIGLERMEEGSEDRIEKAGLEYHREVYEAYRRLKEEAPHRIIAVDAGQSREEVHGIVRKGVIDLISAHYVK